MRVCAFFFLVLFVSMAIQKHGIFLKKIVPNIVCAYSMKAENASVIFIHSRFFPLPFLIFVVVWCLPALVSFPRVSPYPHKPLCTRLPAPSVRLTQRKGGRRVHSASGNLPHQRIKHGRDPLGQDKTITVLHTANPHPSKYKAIISRNKRSLTLSIRLGGDTVLQSFSLVGRLFQKIRFFFFF